MVRLEIPGFGLVELEHLVSDFTGTLSEDGALVKGVRERFSRLSRDLRVHILTADTFGRAVKELEGVDCTLHILAGPGHDLQKEEYVRSLGPEKVVAMGNGINDRRMLSLARVGIAVCLREGCAADALKGADLMVTSALDALDLLLEPRRLLATLRF
jgi:soluble P-type ATPase